MYEYCVPRECVMEYTQYTTTNYTLLRPEFLVNIPGKEKNRVAGQKSRRVMIHKASHDPRPPLYSPPKIAGRTF